MPSSSFLVRGIDERIRDLSMRSEMQAHSHRAMPTVTSPICNDATIGRTVVHLPPPAVYLLPRPVLSSLTPEILAPTAVDPIQTLSVALAKIRRSRRVRFGGVPATPRRGAAMRGPLKAYTRGNQIRPDLLLTPRGRPSVGRLISFWDAPMVAMGISPPPEVYGEVSSYIAHTPCQAQNEPLSDMDISPPKLETDPIKPKTVSGLVSFWNSMFNDMDMDMAPPPTEHGKQHVPVMEWGLSDVKEPTSPMDMPSPSRDNDHEEELEHLWGVSDRSVDDSVKSTPKIATISADNLFRIRTPESPKVETMDMDMSGFLGKENMTPSPILKSSVSKGYEFSPKNPVSSRDTTHWWCEMDRDDRRYAQAVCFFRRNGLLMGRLCRVIEAQSRFKTHFLYRSLPPGRSRDHSRTMVDARTRNLLFMCACSGYPLVSTYAIMLS
ncbi:hypothetical protein BASA61_007907 [Batrachochytrium salamandrivorans]|nr:hypothetical protein BASA61_007907 [Batrachochytrium salamandrivorans]